MKMVIILFASLPFLSLEVITVSCVVQTDDEQSLVIAAEKELVFLSLSVTPLS